VILAQAGDERAFGELVRRRQSHTRGLLRQLSGDHALGDDLAQEAFVLAWRKIHQVTEPVRLGGWLRRIAVTIWMQHARRKRLSLESLDDEVTAAAHAGAMLVEKLDLEAALDRLKAGERLCVVLAYREGMSHAEVAAATGLPLGTVKSNISRSAAKLRRWLGGGAE
jgi:RNA polymerase sigma-70 factor (ECF subfamily)